MTTMDLIEGVSSQSLGQVFRAELRRLLRQGGLRRACLLALGLSVLLGVMTLLLIDQISGGQADDGTAVTVPVETTASMAGIILGIAVTLHYGRLIQDGGVGTALALVPRRARLFSAQFLATGVVAAATATLAGSVTTLVAVAATGTNGLGAALMAVAAGGIACALLAATAQATAYLVGGPVPALLTLVGWWIALPLALAAGSQFVAAPASQALTTFADWTPISIQIRATNAGLQAGEVQDLLLNLGALFALAAALGWISVAALNRRDF